MTITDCVEYGQLKLGHRDEALTLSVRPLLDKFGGAVSNWVIGFAAVAAGMTAGSENHVSAQGEMNFKLIVFVAPLVLIVIGLLIFLTRVKLTEEKHAEIVAELEKTWGKDALGANASAEDEATIASATEEAIPAGNPLDPTKRHPSHKPLGAVAATACSFPLSL